MPDHIYISEAQTRRLIRLAEDAGHTPGSLRRLLRAAGYAGPREVPISSYDAVCRLAESRQEAIRFNPAFVHVEGERPFLKGISDEEAAVRMIWLNASTESLIRFAKRSADVIAGSAMRPDLIPDEVVRYDAEQLDHILDELRYRIGTLEYIERAVRFAIPDCKLQPPLANNSQLDPTDTL